MTLRVRRALWRVLPAPPRRAAKLRHECGCAFCRRAAAPPAKAAEPVKAAPLKPALSASGAKSYAAATAAEIKALAAAIDKKRFEQVRPAAARAPRRARRLTARPLHRACRSNLAMARW